MQIPNSQRLKFHFMTAADKKKFFELDQDPEVMHYITGRTTTWEEIDSWYIPRLAKYADQETGWGLWGMTRLDNDKYIGWILVRPMNFFDERRDDDDIELGWRLFRSEWGNGYATEGARAVMDALREHKACSRFSALAIKENAASTNVMKKLGMTFVTEEIHTEPDPRLDDELCVLYSCPAETE